jgi:hypothetical protein
MPTFAAAGVPLNSPVAVSNAIQPGLASMPNTSGSPSASVADGLNEYALP